MLVVFVVLMLCMSGCVPAAEKNEIKPAETPEYCQINVKSSVVFEDYGLEEIGSGIFTVSRPDSNSNWEVPAELLKWHELVVLPKVDEFKSNINTRWPPVVTNNFVVSADGFWNNWDEMSGSWENACPDEGFVANDNIHLTTNLKVEIVYTTYYFSLSSDGNEFVFSMKRYQMMDILTGKILPVALDISPVAVSPENFSVLTKDAVVLYKATDPSSAKIYDALIYGFGSWEEDRIVVTTMENGIIYGAMIPADPNSNK